MSVKLDASQTKTLYLDDDRELLITGVAGTGKSIVAVYRAIYLAKKYPDKKILLTAYNRNLITKMEKDVQSIKEGLNNLVVETFHTAAKDFIEKITGNEEKYNGRKKSHIEQAYNECKEKTSEDIIDAKVEDIREEIEWIQSFGIKNYEEYLDAERIGRKKFRVERIKRRFIYSIYESYLQYRAQEYKFDYNDVGSYLEKLLIPEEEKYDYIIVDEYQDLSTDMLYGLNVMLKSTGKYEFIGDENQSIFGKRISWKNLNINIRTFKKVELNLVYRTTRQIQQLARNYLGSDIMETVVFNQGYKPLYYQFSSEEEEYKYIAERAEELHAASKDYCVIFFENYESKKLKEYYKDIKLCSIGTVKGLEYDTVILPNVTQKRYLDLTGGFEEEIDKYRKKMYVALTRASKNLVLTGSGEMDLGIKLEDVKYDKK